MKLVLSLGAAVLIGCATMARAGEKSQESQADGWIKLFDGGSLNGWKASEHPEQWKVEDGAIVAGGPRSHLFYIGSDESQPAEFVNFHFKADVMTSPGSNSGIFFHSKYQSAGWPDLGYESQVNNTHGDPVKTGSLYYVVKIFDSPAKDNIWWTQEVIVDGKRITMKVDGRTLYEYDEPEGVKGPHKLSRGTFALQAHDPKSVTLYKNVMVKRLPDTKP
jgi:hypothetical protein